jgi:hypothetical protein
MKSYAAWRDHVPGAIGALIGAGVMAAFLLDLSRPGVQALPQSGFDASSLALAVGEFLALGVAAGLLAFALKRLVTRRGQSQPASVAASLASDAALPTVALAPLALADPTASEFDDARLPGFAPVVSLSEAQAERALAQRQRRERRVAVNSF